MRELATYEALLLLGLHDEKGTDTTQTGALDKGVVGAALVDLVRAGALGDDPEARHLAVAGPPPGDPFLAAVHAEVAGEARPRTAKHWVDRLPGRLKPVRERAAARLVEEGVLDQERAKMLGLFPHTRLKEADPAPERALREALHAVLVTGREPTEPEAQLVALVRALELEGRVVAKEDRKQARRRAKEIAEATPGSEAVRRAVQDVHAAVIASVAATTAATAATSS